MSPNTWHCSSATGAYREVLPNLIYRHSGGNSLFMVTIVQDMVKKGLLAEVDGIWRLDDAA